jgi:hypothetical protein
MQLSLPDNHEGPPNLAELNLIISVRLIDHSSWQRRRYTLDYAFVQGGTKEVLGGEFKHHILVFFDQNRLHENVFSSDAWGGDILCYLDR